MSVRWYILVSVSIFLIICMAAAGCASDHHSQVSVDRRNALTVGKVQKEITVGMSSASVIEVLGSPNIVSTDDQRREVWVYDRVATETVYSRSGGGAFVIIFGGGGGAGATSTTQKMLTIIIKFDEHSKVRTFSYNSSSF